jgi:selenocysteine-specific elongation factor
MNVNRDLWAVIGTAGHVDHGKTTLVQHLTGIDTDRLKEEKARGISIELGFAWLEIDQRRIAIVDVPGHERFVRQMIAGAAGIDFVLFVVAADEGVMPQTREHLDICTLLGVQHGAIVLTKSDLVDEDWIELVREDVSDTVEGTFLEGAPVVNYSRGDEPALRNVKKQLAEGLEKAEKDGMAAKRSVDRPFKMSVDRVFTMRGFGSVVTGTTSSGELTVGDTVHVLPGRREGRVRGMQTQGESVERIGPGVRAAVNIQGIDHGNLHRGDVLTRPTHLLSSHMFNGEMRLLARASQPLPSQTRALVHIGTSCLEATLVWMGTDEAMPGENTPVQVRFDTPIVILPGEPFVVRGFSTFSGLGKTIGGGRALCPAFRRYRNRERCQHDFVLAWMNDRHDDALGYMVGSEGQAGIEEDRLPALFPEERTHLATRIAKAVKSGQIVSAGGRLFHREAAQTLAERATKIVADFHRSHGAQPGIMVEELRTRIRHDLEPTFLSVVLEDLVSKERLKRNVDLVALANFTPFLSESQQRTYQQVIGLLEEADLQPPRIHDLPEMLDLSEVILTESLGLLMADEKVVRVNKDFYFATRAIEALKTKLVQYLKDNKDIDTAHFKELTGASRKWTIPLGEYFDKMRITVRDGDTRRLHHRLLADDKSHLRR